MEELVLTGGPGDDYGRQQSARGLRHHLGGRNRQRAITISAAAGWRQLTAWPARRSAFPSPSTAHTSDENRADRKLRQRHDQRATAATTPSTDGSGNDIINAGSGSNTVTGGGGSDTFVYQGRERRRHDRRLSSRRRRQDRSYRRLQAYTAFRSCRRRSRRIRPTPSSISAAAISLAPTRCERERRSSRPIFCLQRRWRPFPETTTTTC